MAKSKYQQMPPKGSTNWVVTEITGELAVTHSTFEHGFQSYGWSGTHKMVVCADPDSLSQADRAKAREVAEDIATSLNKHFPKGLSFDPKELPDESEEL